MNNATIAAIALLMCMFCVIGGYYYSVIQKYYKFKKDFIQIYESEKSMQKKIHYKSTLLNLRDNHKIYIERIQSFNKEENKQIMDQVVKDYKTKNLEFEHNSYSSKIFNGFLEFLTEISTIPNFFDDVIKIIENTIEVKQNNTIFDMEISSQGKKTPARMARSLLLHIERTVREDNTIINQWFDGSIKNYELYINKKHDFLYNKYNRDRLIRMDRPLDGRIRPLDGPIRPLDDDPINTDIIKFMNYLKNSDPNTLELDDIKAELSPIEYPYANGVYRLLINVSNGNISRAYADRLPLSTEDINYLTRAIKIIVNPKTDIDETITYDTVIEIEPAVMYFNPTLTLRHNFSMKTEETTDSGSMKTKNVRFFSDGCYLNGNYQFDKYELTTPEIPDINTCGMSFEFCPIKLSDEVCIVTGGIRTRWFSVSYVNNNIVISRNQVEIISSETPIILNKWNRLDFYIIDNKLNLRLNNNNIAINNEFNAQTNLEDYDYVFTWTNYSNGSTFNGLIRNIKIYEPPIEGFTSGPGHYHYH